MLKLFTASILLVFLLPTLTNATVVRQTDNQWVVENHSLLVTIDSKMGSIAVWDKVSGYDWKQPVQQASDQPRFRNVRQIADGITFEADFGWTKDHANTAEVSLSIPDAGADLVVSCDMRDRNAAVDWMPFLEPFVLDTDNGVIAMADYCNGRLYPTDLKPFPAQYYECSRLDMPWIGVCDLHRGMGYALIVETSDDAVVQSQPHKMGDHEFTAPQIFWTPSKGAFAYPRKLIYSFKSKGGYVALAKAYRAYATKQGLIVPFSEKLKKNPRISRLFGAPDVWGDASLSFAEQAKSAGVDKMLIHGRTTPEDMKAINALGYLTSEYDNYTDVEPLAPGAEVESAKDILPDNAVMKADGTRMTAWLTWDKKIQYMKRCPALWTPAANVVITKLLKTYPYIGRFIDVTTAEGLYECYDPKHPMTKSDKRQAGVSLLTEVRRHGLVVGGEHGIWWGVPVQDYIEGMMSGGHYPWPAGYLLHPDTKTQEFKYPDGNKMEAWSEYEKWGIGHEVRVPLWELVFHDCVVSTWYWGDASDYLLKAAQEITPKKDAFNILYGTIPLLWADSQGAWQSNRKLFLSTYRNTCKLHEAIAGTQMLSHEFVTSDRAVQQTRFSDGTIVFVNFGEKPYIVSIGGKKHLLGQNDFAVKGPKIEQTMEIIHGKSVTTIKCRGYLFTDANGRELTLRSAGKDRITVLTGPSDKPLVLRPFDIDKNWDTSSTLVYALDKKGRRTINIPFTHIGNQSIAIKQFPTDAGLELVCKSQTKPADLIVENPNQSVINCKQGQKIHVPIILRNNGGTAAVKVNITLYADDNSPSRKLSAQNVSISAQTQKRVQLLLDTSDLDGKRSVVVFVDPENKIHEICKRNNQALLKVAIARDTRLWQHKRILRTDVGAGETVCVPMQNSNINPESVRVVEIDQQNKPIKDTPAQCDKLNTGNQELCFTVQGGNPERSPRRFMVLWSDNNTKKNYYLPGESVWNPDTKVIDATTYRTEFADATLTNIAAKKNGVAGKPFIVLLIYSSADTGWSLEPGKVEAFEIISRGPVRTTIHVRKALDKGVTYDKYYTFYPDRFDLTMNVTRYSGFLSRAIYAQSGQYTDSAGIRAVIDGKGQEEGVNGAQPNPKWYCVYSDNWAHSCIALSEMDCVGYWDDGTMGQTGFLTGKTKNIRMSYVIHPGAKDASFAAQDSNRLNTPAAIEWE